MSMIAARWFGSLVFGIALAFSLPAEAAPTFPALTGRVVDQADVLPVQVENELSVKLEELEASTSRQLVIVTVASLQGYEIEAYGYQLGRAWGIGEARKDTGILFIVAPNERRVRIEVGYGLEPFLTDALSNAILQYDVLPLFRDGKFADGIAAGADALIEQLSLPADQATARAQAAEKASGEAKPDSLSFFIIGLVALWLVLGLVGAITGRTTDIWFWPLFFLMRGDGGGGKDPLR
jgi:uncharacterized protein